MCHDRGIRRCRHDWKSTRCSVTRFSGEVRRPLRLFVSRPAQGLPPLPGRVAAPRRARQDPHRPRRHRAHGGGAEKGSAKPAVVPLRVRMGPRGDRRAPHPALGQGPAQTTTYGEGVLVVDESGDRKRGNETAHAGSPQARTSPPLELTHSPALDVARAYETVTKHQPRPALVTEDLHTRVGYRLRSATP